MNAIGHHNITDINIRRNVDADYTKNLELEVENSSDFEDSSQKQPLQLLKTLDVKSITTNYKGPFNTFISALDFLPDGRLVALDCFRCMFYLFDEQLNGCIGWYTFESAPLNMTCYKDQNVAVTLE